ncbi:MAG: hypothetical protein ABIP51_00380 [Bacteroidia bacterium]
MRGLWFISWLGPLPVPLLLITNCPRYFFVAGLNRNMMSQQNPQIEIEDELQRFMMLHGFNSVEEIKKIQVEELLKMDGFGWRIAKKIQS